jgi:hypothetical protein
MITFHRFAYAFKLLCAALVWNEIHYTIYFISQLIHHIQGHLGITDRIVDMDHGYNGVDMLQTTQSMILGVARPLHLQRKRMIVGQVAGGKEEIRGRVDHQGIGCSGQVKVTTAHSTIVLQNERIESRHRIGGLYGSLVDVACGGTVAEVFPGGAVPSGHMDGR